MKPLHLPYLILKTLAVCYCWHCHCRFVNLDTTQGLFFSFLQTPWSHVHPKAFPFQANCRLMLCTPIFSISSSLTVKTTRILFSSFLLPVFLLFLLNGDESQCLSETAVPLCWNSAWVHTFCCWTWDITATGWGFAWFHLALLLWVCLRTCCPYAFLSNTPSFKGFLLCLANKTITFFAHCSSYTLSSLCWKPPLRLRIIESSRLEKTFKIKSNHQFDLPSPITKPCLLVPRLWLRWKMTILVILSHSHFPHIIENCFLLLMVVFDVNKCCAGNL